jgi:cytochrome c biogenesis protein CcmG/thiol:disulfide interchange protein DsbE
LVDTDVAVEKQTSQRSRRLVVPALAVVAVCLLLGLLYYGLTTQRLETGISPAPNAVAPDFTLNDFSGKPVHLADLQGKTVVLNFWASWCVPCRDEQPAMQAVWQQYQNRGVVFLGINVQDDSHDAQAYLQQFNVTYPNVSDPNGAVYINYGVVGVPEMYVVTARGTIGKKLVGPVDPSQLTSILEELLR